MFSVTALEDRAMQGANFLELRKAEVQLRRIHLSRSWVNMVSGLFGRFVEVTDRAQPPLARLPAAEIRAEHRHQDVPIPPWPCKQTRKRTNAVFDG